MRWSRAEIAPADVNREPEYLPGDGVALYALIWLKFIAAHMPPAQERIMAARMLVGASKEKPYPLELRATAKLLYFDGWHRVVPTAAQDEVLPFLPEGTPLQPMAITVEAVTNEPPTRFTEGTLASALATTGMSVASAARAVEQLQAAGYVTAGDDSADAERKRTSRCGLSGCVVCRSHLIPICCRTRLPTSPGSKRVNVSGSMCCAPSGRAFGGMLRPAPAVRVAAEHKPIVLHPAEEV